LAPDDHKTLLGTAHEVSSLEYFVQLEKYLPNFVISVDNTISAKGSGLEGSALWGNRAWDLGEEKDKEVQKFPLNRGDDKPRRCEQHF